MGPPFDAGAVHYMRGDRYPQTSQVPQAFGSIRTEGSGPLAVAEHTGPVGLRRSSQAKTLAENARVCKIFRRPRP
jgi:hypothetical protein